MLSNLGNYTYSQTLTKYAKQRNQELAERQRMERTNYEKACKEGTLDSYKEYLSMYPRGKYVQDVKSRISEIERKFEQDFYDKVCSQETAQAYQDYINKYPNGQYVQEARGRIDDMELWQRAKTANTIVAYKNYLSSSKNKSFAQLANDAITDLESKDAWETIQHSSTKADIEVFILKYPKSSFISEATKRHDELLAVEYYEQGNLQLAYEKFEAAGGRNSIEVSNRLKYNECQEYVDYKKLNPYIEHELFAFLNKYPTSKYRDQVSNMVAIEKAKRFSTFSNSYTYNDAMSYAKDKATRNTVQNYIDKSKRLQRQYKRHQRHNRVKANGGYIKYGIELIDFGVTGISDDSEEKGTAVYFNMGLSIKFGNYKSPIQFEIGIKPGVARGEQLTIIPHDNWDSRYEYHYSEKRRENKTFFHMPVYAKLKLNIISILESELYIAGLGVYNAIRENNFENKFSLGGGIGFAWKKWDWFTLYYKQDLENKLKVDDRFIGTSLVYYI